eukprot:1411317-Alexandrium_andersonii.AAC.1
MSNSLHANLVHIVRPRWERTPGLGLDPRPPRDVLEARGDSTKASTLHRTSNDHLKAPEGPEDQIGVVAARKDGKEGGTGRNPA